MAQGKVGNRGKEMKDIQRKGHKAEKRRRRRNTQKYKKKEKKKKKLVHKE